MKKTLTTFSHLLKSMQIKKKAVKTYNKQCFNKNQLATIFLTNNPMLNIDTIEKSGPINAPIISIN